MPLYEYQCESCKHRFEKIQKYTDPPPAACPSCGGTVRKLASSPAIQFKGSGWYITDYKKSGSDSAKSSGGKPDSSDTAESSGGKSDGGKSDGGKSDSGKSDSGEKSGGGAEASGKSDSSRSSSPEKADKPAVKSDTPAITKTGT